MTDGVIRGWTCQRDVPARLAANPEGLAGSWRTVAPTDVVAFRTMVDLLLAAGIPVVETPLWAWAGPATPLTVEQRLTSLLSEAELELDQYIVEFRVPRDLVVRTDYGRWCDYYFSTFDSVDAPVPDRPTDPDGDQLTLGLLRAEWITRVSLLDRTGWTAG